MGPLWRVALCIYGFQVGCAFGQELVRGPYLQRGSPTSMVIRWRTSEPSQTRLEYGTSRASLSVVTQSGALTTEHEVELQRLVPQTRYYYKIAANSKVLAGGDDDHYFVTSPDNVDEPTRVWILGDAGSSGRLTSGEDPFQSAVRDAFLQLHPPHDFNFVMMLGDNAYNTGTDVEYQRGFFDVYRSVLRSKVFWPTQGNHDASAQGYFKVFSLPTRGESGGIASGTERYYSMDHGNVHFISLNSENRDVSSRASMINWLRRDLAANSKVWTIVFWHHPPYSKGSHDSDNLDDSGGRMAWMRENILPILEDAGVDIVFSGHSHSYERSKLIDRHYGVADEFSKRSIVQPGDGRGDQAYIKDTLSKTPHSGTVYVVSGSAGNLEEGSLNHPAMVVSKAKLGSVLLSVDGNEAEATMVGVDGNIEDSFMLRKDPTRPRAVRNLTATVTKTDCRIDLAWQRTRGDLSYVMYRSVTSDSRGSEIGRVSGGAAHFKDTNVPASTGSLWYSVRAINARGLGPWGDVAFLSDLPDTCSAPK
jgi:hypothetical protein